MENCSGSALKLVVEKGRRRGETAEFPWGTTVTIGRIIRGNNFTIKDPSISQSHISITGGATESWTITDLDSSNGTFLNGAAIKPSIPVDLHDGDIVKIGERTTIRIEIVAAEIQKGTSGSERLKEETTRGEGGLNVDEERNPKPKFKFDLEKMTLEEWFDNMEKYLPKAITEIQDEVIAQIKARAEKLNEYLEHSYKNRE